MKNKQSFTTFSISLRFFILFREINGEMLIQSVKLVSELKTISEKYNRIPTEDLVPEKTLSMLVLIVGKCIRSFASFSMTFEFGKNG